MKKIFYIIILLVISLSFACKKYSEGPLISLRSVDKRIIAEWQVIGFTSDGVDSLQYYNDSCGSIMWIYKDYHDATYYRINFEGDNIGFGGTFNFSDNKKVMNIYLVDIGITYWGVGPIGSDKKSEWKILKLTMDELKTSIDYNSKNYLISFKRSTQ